MWCEDGRWGTSPETWLSEVEGRYKREESLVIESRQGDNTSA